MLRSTYLLVLALIVAAMALPTPRSQVTPERPSPVTTNTLAVRNHPLTEAELAKASATIDQLVADGLIKAGVPANPEIDEPVFLRRAYLTIIGRMPTLAEATQYLDNAKGKTARTKLIAALLDHPGRVSNEYTWWADLLRASTRLNDRYPGLAYTVWIKESIKANKPYDAMVRELITADGPALARGNGATGYYLRDAGMPLDNMANTVQVFLGTRVQCAMCHDHPFDKWKRKEFYELAAYTNSVGIRREVEGLGKYNKKIRDEGASQGVRDAMRMLGDTIALGVRGGDKTDIALPHDYQYPDAKPEQKVSAKPLFGEVPPIIDGKMAKDQATKKVYAAWMTEATNPRFATVVANRLWKRAFGIGLVEPVDNFTDTTAASNPQLMAYLTKLMVSVDFDLKRFQGIIYNTAAWQRAATTTELAAGDAYHFPGPLLRRMTAEQLWDSLLTLAVPDIDNRGGETAEKLYKFYDDHHDKNAKQLYDLALELGGKRDQMRTLDQEQRQVRAVIEANPDKSSLDVRKARARIKEINDEREALAQETDAGRMISFKKNTRGPEQFVRASELPSPAPAGHFLRTFGQSDREVIEAANASPATTQALALLNGFIDRELFKDRSVLYQAMLAPKDVGGKVDVLFLSCLGRKPSDAERELGKTEITRAMLEFRKSNKAGMGADVSKESAKTALHNLAWVLLNSNEFMFVQ